MKKATIILSILIAHLIFSGCERRYDKPEELINTIRKESSFSSDKTDKIVYAGASTDDNSQLLWYIMGNDMYNLKYIPAQCYLTSENELIFVQTFKPMNRGENISVLQWNGGYSFIVNNPDCVQIKIRKGYEIKEIPVTQYPFVYYYDFIPNEYDFIDNNGNVLTY